MVCGRCIAAVETIFSEAKIPLKSIVLGEIETEQNLSQKQLDSIEKRLAEIGFERIKDSAHQLIEKIKNLKTN